MSVCEFASQRYRYDSRYPSSGYSGGPNKGVLHTTEGSSLPSYDNGAKAPHFTIVPDTRLQAVSFFQHFDTNRPSRALRNQAGGVQTNNDGVVQIELVGTCAKGGPGLFWPAAPKWALDGLARLMRWVEADRGIPRNAAKVWLPYPESYGATRARMSAREWDAFAGWCGHQHVTENDHGDPGQLDMAYLVGLDGGDDMYTDADRARADLHHFWLEDLLRRVQSMHVAGWLPLPVDAKGQPVVPDWRQGGDLTNLAKVVSAAVQPQTQKVLAAIAGVEVDLSDEDIDRLATSLQSLPKQTVDLLVARLQS